MNYLIDTQIFLWFISGSVELSEEARRRIEDSENEIFVSIASLWEISIKTALGKLTIKGSYATVIDDVTSNEMVILPINFMHTVGQNKLPFYHKDPFDRMIISQAIIEEMNLISSDTVFDDYLRDKPVKRIF
ncbi:type II toxin-antitoxin system VapC family toxin [Spirosoma luteum]|uniref:type II toxin-antitoxin system VapC family toxin n=1 Tax=Spirosoma luteum TaxID=431553 RepID=UPI00035F2EC8|nr:type II toxin-antitoxin system VapC family toxin [Spirosoma luteum]